MTPFSEHDALCDLVLNHGLLHATEQQRLLSRRGVPMQWTMDAHAISLSHERLNLVARGMLHLLSRFGSQPLQLATLGTAAVPLLSACVLLSQGRYSGLMVREKPKAYGSGRRVDGPIDPSLPVVIIDDALGSGTTLLNCAEALEEAGLYVLGAACLVRFHWYSGVPVMRSRGYQLETLIDHASELMPRAVSEPIPPSNAALFDRSGLAFDRLALFDGLSLTSLIDAVVRHYWHSGKVLQPPQKALIELDTRGGVLVSFRSRHAPYHTRVREGFLRFPDEPEHLMLDDLVLASARCARQLKQRLHSVDELDDLVISVSALSPMQPCRLADIDSQRDTVVVRSCVRSERFGLALPMLPGVSNAVMQYQHARLNNTQLDPLEPHTLYKASLDKRSNAWSMPSHGGTPRPPLAAWFETPALMQPLLRALWQDLLALQQGESPQALCQRHLPQASLVFITAYQRGQWVACQGVHCHSTEQLVSLLRAVCQQAKDTLASDALALSLCLQVLHSPRYAGLSDEQTLPVYTHGHEALQVSQADKRALMLPQVVHDHDLSPNAFIHALKTKAGIEAGIEAGQCQWQAYQVCSWQVSAQGECLAYANPCLLDLPTPSAPAQLQRHLSYLQQRQLAGLLTYADELPSAPKPYAPCSTAAVLASQLRLSALQYQAMGLSLLPAGPIVPPDCGALSASLAQQPSWQALAHAGFALMLLQGPLSDELCAGRDRLCQALVAYVFENGGIAPSAAEAAARPPAEQRHVPSVVLLGLHAAGAAARSELGDDLLWRALSRVFDQQRYWRFAGLSVWPVYALATWGETLSVSEWQQQLFHEADALLEVQSPEGAFFQPTEPVGQGASSAEHLSVLAMAAVLAGLAKQREQAQRYYQAAQRCLAWLGRLTLREPEAPRFARMAQLCGGVRAHAQTHRINLNATLSAAEAMVWLIKAEQVLTPADPVDPDETGAIR